MVNWEGPKVGRSRRMAWRRGASGCPVVFIDRLHGSEPEPHCLRHYHLEGVLVCGKQCGSQATVVKSTGHQNSAYAEFGYTSQIVGVANTTCGVEVGARR